MTIDELIQRLQELGFIDLESIRQKPHERGGDDVLVRLVSGPDSAAVKEVVDLKTGDDLSGKRVCYLIAR